jgi:Tol biopolymer transport system component/DNA-binding winged helix-turn-helix (wHTH) protein
VLKDETNPTAANLVRFSSFELDLRAGELRKHGLRIKLQDQPFQILALLLEKPGEVVTRDQIRNRLWPVDTFVDFDHSLNSAIKKLRQALSDDPDVPRFIETLPRRGYRFIAEIRNGSDPAPALTEQQSATNGADDKSSARAVAAAPAPPARSHHWKLWLAGVFGFVLALALAYWFRPFRPVATSSSGAIRLLPLTTYSGEFSRGSFSPDGNEIAYASEGEKEDQGIDIYIKQLGVDKPLQVTRDFGFNFFPGWSPDGRYIAFLHQNHGQDPGIYVIPALGGPPRKLHAFDHREDCKPSLSWSADARFLIFSDHTAGQPCHISQLTVEDQTVRPLTSPPVPSTGDWNAEYSPDGSNIAFIRNTKDVEDIYVMRASGGTPRRVTFDNRLLSGLAWTPDSKELIFSSNRGGATWGLWRVAVEGGSTPERLFIGSERAYMPTVSLRGNRLAYASGSWTESIWRVPIGPGHRGGKPEKIITSSMVEEGPQYSPDGKHIVFQSTRSGNFEIWRADPDGSNLVQLTSFGGPLTGTPRWSPDGTQIVFDTRPGPHPNVHIISADGGPPRRFVNDSADEGVASWSHDGHWIYYASNRSGSWQVWKRTVDGGQPVQVTKNGGFAPLEAPDGRSLYYTKFDDHGVWQVPIVGGEETKIIQDEPFKGYWGYFAVGPDGLYFIGDTGTAGKHQAGFKFYDYATKKITNICDMQKDPYEGAPGLSVSSDGRNILYVQVDESRNNLMLAENFK